jgi:hypothetical protein
MKEALRSSVTAVLTRATRHNIPEDAILRSHRREDLTSYIVPFWAPGSPDAHAMLHEFQHRGYARQVPFSGDCE